MARGSSRKARAELRRKRRLDSMVHDLSDCQWAALKDAWAGCAYCGAADQPLQRDCVLPISRGGRYTLDNVVPACRSCNTSKCSDEVTGWLRRKRLDERSFLLRHLEILTAIGRSDPFDSPAAVRSSNEVTATVITFRERLGIEPGHTSADAKRWNQAAEEVSEKVR